MSDDLDEDSKGEHFLWTFINVFKHIFTVRQLLLNETPFSTDNQSIS